MTPQQIAAYKQRWMMNDGYSVSIHSDLRDRAKTWCKQLRKEEWDMRQYTNVYEDTFFFEKLNVGQQFEEEFYRWVVRDYNSSNFNSNK
jgi:hypothetical protein